MRQVRLDAREWPIRHAERLKGTVSVKRMPPFPLLPVSRYRTVVPLPYTLHCQESLCS